MIKNGFLLLVFCCCSTLCFAQATTPTCKFEYPFAGAKLGDVFNGPVLCRHVIQNQLEVDGSAHLDDSQIKQQLLVHGDVFLYHAQLGSAVVYGNVDGKDCMINGLLTIYGNKATFENCTVNNVNIYANGISAFPPTVNLISSKIRGKVRFYNRQGRVVTK